MDLGTFFDSVEASAIQAEASAFPTFPTSLAACGNDQAADNKEISHTSHISHLPSGDQGSSVEQSVQARASAHVSARTRGPNSNRWEMWETWEIIDRSGTYFSHITLQKWEMWEKAGRTFGLSAPTFDERAAFLEYECGLPRAEAEAQARAEGWR